ncbi:alkaline phosphatase family protein [Dyadobacter crusticola]|uniref:alkaline phosphatase family protein n=1 Tax=Dyadobacter crusticola TaxID=292407 RepID=UPI0004E155F6|nr:alkaline phosphatase family protein [Dyadobacter crusticola]
MKKLFAVVCCLLLLPGLVALAQTKKPGAGPKNKTLIVFFDGLRPDYITAEQMPNLFAFKEKAAFGANHHSVFPTVTRVNSASYATGSYPGTHGLLGNSIYIPEVKSNAAIGTGYGDLSQIPAATGGGILTAPSLGEILESAGEKMMVFSSGTTGQAFLQNYKVSGGAIVNPGLILPETFKAQVLAEMGEVTKEGNEDFNRHKWVTDALLKYGLAANGPLVSAIWLSDPDGAAHEHGIGSPEAVEAIKFVDGQFGRILDAIQKQGLADKWNIIISTDHGFVTQIGSISLTDFLVQEGLKQDKESDDVIVAEGSIYVKDHNPETIQKIVSALQEEEWIGAIFTKAKQAGDVNGWIEGTFAFDAVHFNHPRAGDILVAPAWNDVKNDKGFAGTDYTKGKAGHGGSSPYEIHIALFAKGPDFKSGGTTELPTSNIDIVPTILQIYNIPQPAGMDGRPVSELLKKPSKSIGKARRESLKTEVKHSCGTYFLTLEMSVVGKYRYFDHSKTERVFSK